MKGGLLLSLVLVPAWVVHGQTSWVNPGTGDWFTAGNWNNGVPDAVTDATLGNGGTAQISAAGAASQTFFIRSTSLLVLSGAGTFDSSGAIVGQNSGDNATVRIENGGDWTNTIAYIGQGAGSAGGVTVTGTDSLWLNTDSLYVGRFANGMLTIEDGGRVTNTIGFIGWAPSTVGEVTVSGMDSLWQNNGALYVGDAGGGTLTIEDGGLVSNTTGSIGSGLSGVGGVTVNGTDSLWQNTGILYVGDGGDGTLTIEDGGRVTNDGATIGLDAGSVGEVTVSGTDSLWQNSDALYVGNGGNGTLTIENGGRATNGQGIIGNNAGSGGEVTVSGADSLWQNGGSVIVGYNGSGTLTIEDGGRVTSGSIGRIGFDAAGEGEVAVTGADSLWQISAPLFVGYVGSGNLVIEAAGVVTNTDGYLGFNSGSEGEAAVSGTGSLWQNSGSLVVGHNGSGTLTVEDGGRVTSSSTSLDNTGSITLNSGGVLETGFVQKNAGGTLDLGGGILRATGNQSDFLQNFAAGDVTINGGGLTFDTQAFTVGITTVLDGAGGLTKIGMGTLTLNAANTYSGATTVMGGTLRQGASGAFTDGTAYVVNGGTLDLNDFSLSVSSLSGSGGGVSLGTASATLLTVSQAGNTGFAGVIAGNGGIAKEGSGTLVLSGNNTFTGGLTLSGGAIEVGHTNALGAGDVAVNGGVLRAMGSTTSGQIMNVAGNYTQGSGGGLALRIFGVGDADQLVIAGSAVLAGNLDMQFGYVPEDGDTFTLLTAAGGLTGKFGTVTDNLGVALELVLTYTANAVGLAFAPDVPVVMVQQLSFADFGATPNQMAVGGGLDGLFKDKGTTDLIRYLNTLNEQDLQAALADLSPEELAAISRLAFQQFQGQFNAFNNRFAELRNGGPAISVAGIRLYDPSGTMQLNPQTLLADTGLENVGGVMMKKLDEPVVLENRWGIYLDGTGTFTDVDGDGNGDGYDFTSGGMTIGTDYRINDNVIVGFQAGYTNTDADFGGAGGDLDADSASWGMTLGWMGNQGTYAHALLGGSYHSFDTERNVLGQKAVGDTDGLGFNTAVVIGHEFGFGKDKKFKMGPEAALKYSWLNVDEYTEKDALGALTIQEQTPDSLKSRLGWRMSYNGNIGKVKLMPWIYAGWEHEYLDAGQSVAAAFPGSPTSGFTVQGVEVAADSAVVGLGVTAGLTETISAKRSYDAEVSPDVLSHGVNGAVRVGF